MSYEIGMAAIELRRPPRLAHTEYCSNDPLKRAIHAEVPPADGSAHTGKSFEDLWDCDFVWSVNDGPVPWATRGRVTDMGHADFMENGSDRRMPKPCPFTDVEEVLAFNAVKEYGLPDFDGLVASYAENHTLHQKRFANQVFTGGYYKTIVSGAIETFGWDMLLEAAAETARFEKVLHSYADLTMHHVKAWAKVTTAPVFIQHDDFVWSSGPFMHPDIYRRSIIPRYAEMWKVLHAAGKKVLFCSDADWLMFVDDIAEAGADGFIFEPMLALDPVVEKYGKTHVIVGSKVDCRTMTFGTKDDIRREIDATLDKAMDCPGFMFAVGNHIPANVPVENALFYIEHLRKNWWRK
ncbi:MAG: hypothetical protein IT440_09775 [Phycisphaeraceae bacterium]|nr:hypothetical protein [Phycisphaeraceae bacterium]